MKRSMHADNLERHQCEGKTSARIERARTDAGTYSEVLILSAKELDHAVYMTLCFHVAAR